VELAEKQKGVVRGVIPAALLTLVGLCWVSLLLPASALPVDEPGARLAWALQWSLLPILTLMVAIGRVANHRFYTPEDIDGAGLTTGTPQARLHRAILQNTLDQAVLAVAAYVIWPWSCLLAGYVPLPSPLYSSSRGTCCSPSDTREERLDGRWGSALLLTQHLECSPRWSWFYRFDC
jgi:hypothetical protein